MTSVVQINAILLFVGCCWFLANSPLWGLCFKNFHKPTLLWYLFTSFPNRYLFSVLFLPLLLITTFVAWRLLSHIIHKEPIAEESFLRYAADFQPTLLLAVSVASFITFWDFTAGNFCYADLRPPYAEAAITSRNQLLSNNDRAQETLASHSFTLEELSNQVIKDVNPKNARQFVEQMLQERTRIVDETMKNLNLVNVWFFAFTAWLAIYLLGVSVLLMNSGKIESEPMFSMVKHLLLTAMFYFVALDGASSL